MSCPICDRMYCDHTGDERGAVNPNDEHAAWVEHERLRAELEVSEQGQAEAWRRHGAVTLENETLRALNAQALAALLEAHGALLETACEDCGCEGSNPACRVLDDVDAAIESIAAAKGAP